MHTHTHTHTWLTLVFSTHMINFSIFHHKSVLHYLSSFAVAHNTDCSNTKVMNFQAQVHCQQQKKVNLNDFVYEGDCLKPLTACCDRHLEIRWDDQHHPPWGQPCRRQMIALNESGTHTAMVHKYFLDSLQVYTYHPAPFELLLMWDYQKDVDHHHSVKFGQQWTEKPTNLFQRETEREGEKRS